MTNTTVVQFSCVLKSYRHADMCTKNHQLFIRKDTREMESTLYHHGQETKCYVNTDTTKWERERESQVKAVGCLFFSEHLECQSLSRPLAQYVKLLLPSNAPECMDTYSSTPSISQSAINADSRSPGGPADLLNRLCCIANLNSACQHTCTEWSCTQHPS